jgi:hypothetical protein
MSAGSIEMPEIADEVVYPISFYIRGAADGGTEIVALAKGEQRIYRLNDMQITHLACDATLQVTKQRLAALAAASRVTAK